MPPFTRLARCPFTQLGFTHRRKGLPPTQPHPDQLSAPPPYTRGLPSTSSDAVSPVLKNFWDGRESGGLRG